MVGMFTVRIHLLRPVFLPVIGREDLIMGEWAGSGGSASFYLIYKVIGCIFSGILSSPTVGVDLGKQAE